MNIQFDQLKAETTTFTLDIERWSLEVGQTWGVFNTDGDIGSVLGDLLCGLMPCDSGTIEGITGRVAQVSLVEQQRLLAEEVANDDSEFMDRIDTGTTVRELIHERTADEAQTQQLIEEFDLMHLQDSGFRVLSTGETRRVMLARAVATDPAFLLLDEPYAGLDVAHRQSMDGLLHDLSSRVQLLVVVSRQEDLPEWVDQVALFSQGRLEHQMAKSAWDGHPVLAQMKAQADGMSQQMLELVRSHRHQSAFADPIFELTNGHVAYSDKTVFSGVNWRINQGEHWQVKGPNGCGKSTLLGMIFGDHPQCYCNEIQIFGRQRGTGETIWEIKQHIGMVSSSLHLQYRVDCTALQVIVSGFYDTIGMYTKPSEAERAVAMEWLQMLHMGDLATTSFKKLDYGQQRLLLIARALVKRPTLLILDEPYQGLDFLGRQLVKNALELVARENLGQLLYVSHYTEDSLESIRNILTFVADESTGGYRAVAGCSEAALKPETVRSEFNAKAQ